MVVTDFFVLWDLLCKISLLLLSACCIYSHAPLVGPYWCILRYYHCIQQLSICSCLLCLFYAHINTSHLLLNLTEKHAPRVFFQVIELRLQTSAYTQNQDYVTILSTLWTALWRIWAAWGSIPIPLAVNVYTITTSSSSPTGIWVFVSQLLTLFCDLWPACYQPPTMIFHSLTISKWRNFELDAVVDRHRLGIQLFGLKVNECLRIDACIMFLLFVLQCCPPHVTNVALNKK